jgi:unsaturated rhamnogalacturonyl hydrolase
MEGLWLNTGDARWYKYVQHQMDRLVNKEGEIRTYKLEDYNLDNVLCGRVLLMLYKVTGQEKYYKAAGHLREQLRSQPRTSEGSFWHKQKYVSQVWLDGLYMAQPFFAGCCTMAGMSRSRRSGPTRRLGIRPISGRGPWGGMGWRWWMC